MRASVVSVHHHHSNTGEDTGTQLIMSNTHAKGRYSNNIFGGAQRQRKRQSELSQLPLVPIQTP